MNRLLAEAIIAFLAMPGLVAFLVPLLVLAPARERSIDSRGLWIAGAGSFLLVWCVWEFYRSGKGTLAPWTPPKYLVDRGLYAFSRNPMYVGVILVLWGWALTFHSRGLATYAALLMIVFHVRVVFFEEPWLAETHGEKWMEYAAHVPRWIGRRRGRG